MSQFAGACRWVYNRGLATKVAAWEENGARVTLFDQNIELPSLKKAEETAWLADIHSQVLQQALGDLNNAYTAFFRRCKSGDKPGFPHFRCRGQHDSFRYPQGVRVDGNKVFLPKIGWIRFRKSRDIGGIIKQSTVIREAGLWYVCFSCELAVEDPDPIVNPSVIGIDLGLENFAIIAGEYGVEEISNQRFLRKELDHLRFLSRQLSKKQKGSGSRNKAKERLQKFHLRVRRTRQDYLHKLSTKIVKSHDKIVVESLKVKQLIGQSSRALARSISDAGWRTFLQYLKYKCEHVGKQFVEAGEWFPSTKQCFQCGKLNKMALSDRQYTCDCGFTIHRDHNSAMNLRAVGTTGLKACGAAL